jgi:transposase
MENETVRMNEKEAAKYLGVSIGTMRKWRFESRGPGYAKLGKRVVYCRPDLDTFFDSRRIEPRRA